MAKINAPKLAAIIGTSAAALLIGLTSGSEGVSLTPYNDTIGAHVETVCFGETNVPMRRYTLTECKEILAKSLAEYATAVRATVPGFDSLTDGQKAAAIDYAYNRGLGSWSRAKRKDDPADSVLEAYKKHDFPRACNLMGQWGYVRRSGKWVDCSIRSNGCYGIYVRRQKEKAACLGE